jgi:type IV secretory pathway VirB2 component (pilin)
MREASRTVQRRPMRSGEGRRASLSGRVRTLRMDRCSSRWLGSFALFLGFLAFALFAPSLGFAQDLQPINEVADYIQGFLTGRLATSVAVISVAVVGYLFWSGQIAVSAALAVIGGIAIVFGAAQIVAILEAVAR